MERWLMRDPRTLFEDISPVMRPGSRSAVRLKVDAIGQLLVRVMWSCGDSREEDAEALRGIADFALSAAQDLDPR